MLHYYQLFKNIFYVISFYSVSSFESSRALDVIMELEKLKSYLNNVELQLYEANETVADLLEKVSKLNGKEHFNSELIHDVTVNNKLFFFSTETRIRS